jgi:hypothetical protein
MMFVLGLDVTPLMGSGREEGVTLVGERWLRMRSDEVSVTLFMHSMWRW